MAIFKSITSNDIKTTRSFLNQLIDVIQFDISSSFSRRQYQQFVTGGVGPGVTSSLFETVYDQDFTLQTANAVADFTVGLYYNGSTVSSSLTGQDTSGKLLFPSSSLMMREKVDIYKQFAQSLLGDSTAQFVAPYDSTSTSDKIDVGMFMCFKRLFARDRIKRETFAMRFFQTASTDLFNGSQERQNITAPTTSGSAIYTDVGSSNNKNFAFGGEVGSIVDASNTSKTVGLMFYDRGIAVFDLAKIISGSQHVTGVIDGMNSNTGPNYNAGQTTIGRQTTGAGKSENIYAKFIPDFMVSASINNIVDHLAGTRFGTGSLSAITFQNVTNINSTLVFCRANADEFNYSSNPTFIDSDSRIVVIDPGQEDTQQTFTFCTGVGLYSANDELLAVGKLSRPIEKSPERDITLRVRIDF
jgi:hypothetical protein